MVPGEKPIRVYNRWGRTDQDIDGDGQSVDDFADEVAGRSKAADGEVGAELDAAGATRLGRESLIQACAATFDCERCRVKPGMTSGIGSGLTFEVAPEGLVIVDPGISLGKAGDERTHSLGRTRLRSSANDVL